MTGRKIDELTDEELAIIEQRRRETIAEDWWLDDMGDHFDDGAHDDDPNPYSGTGGDW